MARMSLAFALALTLGGALPAVAQQETAAPPDASPLLLAAAPIVAAAAQYPGPIAARSAAQKRPALLVPMYVSFAALQALDYSSTTRAIAGGAGREANPVMGSVVGNRPAFIAVKAATAAGTIWAGEKIWKKNRTAAVALLAAMNAGVGTVVAHNMSVR